MSGCPYLASLKTAPVCPVNNSPAIYAIPRAPATAPLTQGQIDIVKSTAPILAQHGETITRHFYKRMLGENTELKHVFNAAHQATGTQPMALAAAVFAYASNIDNLGVLGGAVTNIAHKHVSLGITAEQYPIVGKHLIASLAEVLGAAVTPAVADAWTAAYNQLATILINAESALYEQARNEAGGWNGWRKFNVAKRVVESAEIVSFHLKPDTGALPTCIKAGQYISVRVWVPESNVYQPRQYTISNGGSVNKDGFIRISVKQEGAHGSCPAGAVSTLLHKHFCEGAQVEVSMPAGVFHIDSTKTTPVYLIAGGVGITPMMAMLYAVQAQNASGANRSVTFAHATRNRDVQAFADEVRALEAKNRDTLKFHAFYSDASATATADFEHTGLIDIGAIGTIATDADYYVCGPTAFMKFVKEEITKRGVDASRVHTEMFGSGTI